MNSLWKSLADAPGAALGVNAKSRAALFGGANPVIGDDRLGHDDLDLPSCENNHMNV